MEKNREKLTMKQAAALHLWAAKVWWEIEPKLFLSTGLDSCVSALRPFVTVYLSARIIDELAGLRRPAQLWFWVAAVLLVSLGLGFLSSALKRWKAAVHKPKNQYEDRQMNQKMMDMDFAAVEATSTRDLLFEMCHHMEGNYYGFQKVSDWMFQELVAALTAVVSAVALSASLFTQPVPAGPFGWLNHPLTGLCVVVVLLAGTIFSPWLSGQAAGYIQKTWPYTNRYNRCCRTFGMLGQERERAADVRMYRQDQTAEAALLRHDAWKPDSPAWKITSGPMSLLEGASGAVSAVLMSFSYLFVCLKAWAGAFPVGYVTQYVGAITNLCGGLARFFIVLGDLPHNAEYLRVIREFLEIPNDMYQGSLTTEKRSDRQYEVEFRDVSFRYPRSDVWALRHVNVKFQVGSRLAVVGRNGSGKTTFIKLLSRLYDPTEGQILLNGIDIRKYQYNDYLQLFSVVFQDFQLLALPLGENVAAGAAYDRARVLDCLEKAGLGRRLNSMERGLETCLYKDLDENGVEISGGEAQKIAIARALYKDAPFIILDEPTAALDPMAEAEIYSRFNDIVGDKTAIYISHRLSSCKFCNEILVFDQGRVVQQGSHTVLVAAEGGKYSELWHAQAQYYTKNTTVH